ncbi:heat shock transcription factor, X-linked member 3-like [Pteronotus mesoamericanus]|uniref:heat shock transcription factor, X-linked member 3-like n=1 Tax=Pteronotus mesoamericanus TaxID=1884717 RepID=UPI0023EBAA67|nr:heat shock transcription factor, X-linked member 3-like [Pteronotus parnellii mesoamericanus]
MDRAKPAASEDGSAAPPAIQADDSPDFAEGPREACEKDADQAPSQDPSPQDNPQPEDPNGDATDTEGSNILYGLPFPTKLWRIVEDEAFTSVRWSDKGDTVIIEHDLFQRQILDLRGAEKIFEFDSLKSFIRLINLYGFCKIRPSKPSLCYSGTRRLMIYRNPNFQRNKPSLMKNIKRKYKWMTTAPASTPKSKKRQVPPTRGPRGHSATRAGGPSGEGTSRSVPLAPRVPASPRDRGDLATSHLDFPVCDSVMCLYHTCYSLLTAALFHHRRTR